ncbi:hypothetical protein VNI00_003663 [Paramarasmius palmivorus]|uniref:Uncharacterized protein n=1 Tax=Paramarasmius palmivorus TaxID=297713 RepID=A0AAW0DTP3_9AGAR
MPSRSAKKVTAIELSDGDLSDSSIVYVKSGVAPKTKPATKVAAFGDITSDDEVVVVEKKRKPSLTRSESSSPTKSARIAGSSSRQPASSPDGKVRSPAVRDLTEGRPLKLETRDPRPPVTPPRRSVPSNESPTKRPQRTPKPTEKAKYNANTPTTSLAERLDRLTQRDESPEVAEEWGFSSVLPRLLSDFCVESLIPPIDPP